MNPTAPWLLVLATTLLCSALAIAEPTGDAHAEHDGHGEHDGQGEHGAHDGHDAHGDGQHAETHSGQHAETHSGLSARTELIMQGVNIVLLLGVLIWLLRKPLNEFLQNRHDQVAHQLAEAKELKAAAAAKYAEYSQRLKQLDHELERIRTEMRAAGASDRDRMVQEAKERAARMRKEAQFVIDQRMKQLRNQLRDEAVTAAVATAQQVLQQQVQPQDQERLAKEYLERLKGLGEQGGRSPRPAPVPTPTQTRGAERA